MVAVDIDPVVQRDFTAAMQIIPVNEGGLTFILSSGEHVPLEEESVDAVYSISVIEHSPSLVNFTVSEIARILVPGGLFLCTVDIGLSIDSPMDPECYEQLMQEIEERFDWAAPQTTVHPLRVLVRESKSHRAARMVEHARNIRRRLLGRQVHHKKRLSCMGMALRKR